jgi:hypothetical protein
MDDEKDSRMSSCDLPEVEQQQQQQQQQQQSLQLQVSM